MPKLGDRRQFCMRGHDTFVCGRIKGQCLMCKKIVAHIDYENNKTAFIERAQLRRESNRPRDRMYSLTSRWKNIGMTNANGTQFTHVDYDRQYQVQQGRCAVCDQHQTELSRRLSADHDHKTNRFRGLLCINCNNALGNVDDSTELLSRLMVYLQKSREII